MIGKRDIEARRVRDEAGRLQVVAVLAATYQSEKRWIANAEGQFSPFDLTARDVSWFMSTTRGRPAGVVRVSYAPPLIDYRKYDLRTLDPTLQVEDFIDRPGIAEIGRFAVLPTSRHQIMVAATLMRAATIECLEQGITHLITDVFEDDPHSPFGFHTRVLGFRPVATHDTGELNCRSRRITLVLDIVDAYRRLRDQGNWFYRYLTTMLPSGLHEKLGSRPTRSEACDWHGRIMREIVTLSGKDWTPRVESRFGRE